MYTLSIEVAMYFFAFLVTIFCTIPDNRQYKYLVSFLKILVKSNYPFFFSANVIISIECRAWAANMKYKGGDRDREGSVHFEILRD
jgi:hypothetical protein